jgi:hypothetical protein
MTQLTVALFLLTAHLGPDAVQPAAASVPGMARQTSPVLAVVPGDDEDDDEDDDEEDDEEDVTLA